MSRFAELLCDWQAHSGRHDLPWQGTRDPYRIWVSEIMLQQTQVSAVVPYFHRFLERFPNLETLAAAPLDAVLERWAGLGYYARARNLHRCARLLVAEHGGRFPVDAEAIARLPGIGRSTAAAIAVFAFGQRAAILDGNVRRVLARCFGIEGYPGSVPTQKAMWALAETLLPERAIEGYTQGLMDLGAMLCTRSKPFCAACPMHDLCVARQQGRQAELPVARPRKVLPAREIAVLIVSDGRHVLLERRPPTGIWGGLLTLPEGGVAEAREFARRYECHLLSMRAVPGVQHTFTHFRLTMQPLYCRVQPCGPLLAETGWQWLDVAQIGDAALPTPVRKLLARTTAMPD